MQVPNDLGGKGHRAEPVTVCPEDGVPNTNQQLPARAGRKCIKTQSAIEQVRTPRKNTNGTRWSEQEDATLLSFAGEKTARDLAKLLGRTERSVYCRLARLSLSSQIKDGYTLRLLAEDLRVDRAKVRQWMLDGKLEVQNLHVTRSSIKRLCERNQAEIVWKGKVVAALGRPPGRVLETMRRCERTSGRNRRSSGRTRVIPHSYTFRRAGKILQVTEEAIKRLVTAGLLKLSRLRIEEDALKKFIGRYPEEINWQLVDPEILEWLGIRRIDDGDGLSKLPGALKHLARVRTCPGCLHSFRGNGYWTHVKFCREARDLEPEALQWAAEHPRTTIPPRPAGLGKMNQTRNLIVAHSPADGA